MRGYQESISQRGWQSWPPYPLWALTGRRRGWWPALLPLPLSSFHPLARRWGLALSCGDCVENFRLAGGGEWKGRPGQGSRRENAGQDRSGQGRVVQIRVIAVNQSIIPPPYSIISNSRFITKYVSTVYVPSDWDVPVSQTFKHRLLMGLWEGIRDREYLGREGESLICLTYHRGVCVSKHE